MTHKRVLMTGSSSFTGAYVKLELSRQGYTFYDIDKSVDLRDYDKVVEMVTAVKPHYVIHLAALSFVGNTNINEIYETNLLGTTNLLRALDQADLSLKKVILASTANLYGRVSGTITEQTLPSPVNHYGISKYAMEMAAAQWRDTLPLIITRPFNYTGIGQAGHFLVPKIVEHFRQKQDKIELGNVDVSRDFSDVRDVARWYVELLGSEHTQLTVNLCSNTLISLRSIIEKLNDLAGYKINIEVNPEFVRDNEIMELCGDNSLLQSVINIGKCNSINDTLQWMYKAS